MLWWMWLLVAAVAFVGESVTMALYLLYFGIAAFVVALLALFGVFPLVQLMAFVVLSVGLLGVIRPRTLHRLGRQVPRDLLTNQGVRPDREGIVVEDVDASNGMIRLGSAEFWTARTAQPGQVLAKGTAVRVVFVDGLTAFVEPRDAGAVSGSRPRAGDEEAAPGGARG